MQPIQKEIGYKKEPHQKNLKLENPEHLSSENKNGDKKEDNMFVIHKNKGFLNNEYNNINNDFINLKDFGDDISNQEVNMNNNLNKINNNNMKNINNFTLNSNIDNNNSINNNNSMNNMDSINNNMNKNNNIINLNSNMNNSMNNMNYKMNNNMNNINNYYNMGKFLS